MQFLFVITTYDIKVITKLGPSNSRTVNVNVENSKSILNFSIKSNERRKINFNFQPNFKLMRSIQQFTPSFQLNISLKCLISARSVIHISQHKEPWLDILIQFIGLPIISALSAWKRLLGEIL